MDKIIIYGIEDLLDEGHFGRVLTPKECKAVPKNFKCVIPGKWVASKSQETWYIQLSGTGVWHDFTSRLLLEKHAESELVVTCGTLAQFNGALTEIEVRSDAAVPAEVKAAIVNTILAAQRDRIRGKKP